MSIKVMEMLGADRPAGRGVAAGALSPGVWASCSASERFRQLTVGANVKLTQATDSA